MRRFLALFFIGSSLLATDESAWIEPVLVPIYSLDAAYQHFNQLESGGHHCKYPGRDFLASGGLFVAVSPEVTSKLFDFSPVVSGELEVKAARTHHQPFSIDAFKQTIRMQFFDDTLGDFLSVTAGGSLEEPYSRALHDVSLMHKGYVEFEGHLSVGKEWISHDQWTTRTYLTTALGVATQGSPWVRFHLATLFQSCGPHILFFDAEYALGFGGNNLHLHHFRGYGNVAYRFLDLSLGYVYTCDDGQSFEFRVLQRAISRNVPYAIQRVILEWSYPFGL